MPVLSPNGRRLAYVEIPYADGVADYASTAIFVCRVRAHGRGWTCGRSRKVVTMATSSTLSWVPGRDRLLHSGYDASGTDLDIFSIRLRGRQPVDLTDEGAHGTPAFDGHPSVAPDGSWFVYNHLCDLVRRNIDGSDPVPLTTAAPGIVNPHADISPDGTRLVFHSNRDGD